MKSRIVLLALIIFLLPSVNGVSQSETFPQAPDYIKPYKGKPGKISKYNNFNYLDVRDEEGKNRQAMGHYWEIYYTYDSVFRQKRKFKEFVLNQVDENKGKVFYQDTLQVQFAIPSDAGNVWGRLVLSNDKTYRLRLIREVPFVNGVRFDTKPVVVFEKFVDSIALPPRIGYMPRSVITRTQYSKYDHQEFTWNDKDTLFRQKVMGPYWDLKIEVRNQANRVDKETSTVEIIESYYRACVQAGGKIIKSRPRELNFTLPMKMATLWCRITVSLDGVYFVRALIESDKEKTDPEKQVIPPVTHTDSTDYKSDR
jgi:hypothetical protein